MRKVQRTRAHDHPGYLVIGRKHRGKLLCAVRTRTHDPPCDLPLLLREGGREGGRERESP